VPPTSSFSCPPCSIRRRLAGKSATIRYTVCALKQPEIQIQCFEERSDKSIAPIIQKQRIDLDDESPPLYLDFVPNTSPGTESEAPPDVIAVHRDGRVRRVLGTLSQTRWISQSIPTNQNRALPPEVVSAHVLGYEETKSALLKRREDIIQTCPAAETSFLVLVYRSGDHQESGLNFGVFEVPNTLPNHNALATSSQRLRLLVSNPIPESVRWSTTEDLQISLQGPCARLSISSRKELLQYDLSTYTPTVCSKVVFQEQYSSLFPLTSNLAAAANRSAVQIYDTKYQSNQARYKLSTRSKTGGSAEAARKSVRFVSFFAKIKTLVAFRGRNLITFDLDRAKADPNDSSGGDSLLINSIGKGAGTSSKLKDSSAKEVGPSFSKFLFERNQAADTEWESQRKVLDGLVQEQRLNDFERMMAADLTGSSAEQKSASETMDPMLPREDQFVSYEKTTYLLSKIFNLSRSRFDGASQERNTSDLVITFFPRRLFKWLAERNLLGTYEVERALSDQSFQAQLKPGAVAQAIMNYDPSLLSLKEYMGGTNLSSLNEIALVLKMLIEKALATARTGSSKTQLLLEGPDSMALDRPVIDGNEVRDMEVDSNTKAENWSDEAAIALNLALDKLMGFSHTKITSAMSAYLETEETLALVQYLRQQLFKSGHTSSFPSLPAPTNENVLPLELTVSVLCCCMDALGPLGFLGPTFEDDLWQGLVPDLKAEISLALAGIEEATYLKGVLQEMIRYSTTVTSAGCLGMDASPDVLAVTNSDVGKIQRIYGESLDEPGPQQHGRPGLLPLSLKAENTISKTKKRKGGGEEFQRSGRELQYLKSRNVGRYSFERLIL
jgi:hypothetical protein